MSGLSHFIHYPSLWPTKGKLDDLAVSNRMPKQFLFLCWQEQTAQGSPSIFEPCINRRLLSNSLIKALISSWVLQTKCDFHACIVNRHWQHAEDDYDISVSGHGSGGGFAVSDCEWVTCVKTYLWVEVGHFGNTGRIRLPAGIRGTDIQHTGSAIEWKVHKWTRGIELLVDDLCGAEERR